MAAPKNDIADAASSCTTSFNPITRLGSQTVRTPVATVRPPTPVPTTSSTPLRRASQESCSHQEKPSSSGKGSRRSSNQSSRGVTTDATTIIQTVDVHIDAPKPPHHFPTPLNVTVRLDSSSSDSMDDAESKHPHPRLGSSSSSSSEWSAILEKVKALSLATAVTDRTETITGTELVPVRIQGNTRTAAFSGSGSTTVGLVEQLGRSERLQSIGSCCCRICQNCTSPELLISPCRCKGSLAYVHLSCLERWLNQSGRTYCELCQYHFNAIQTPRYRLWQSIRLWYCHPRHRRQLFADMLIAIILTSVTLGLVSIIILGMRYFILEGAKLGISAQCTQFTITFFLAVVSLGYAVTMYLLVKDQVIRRVWLIGWCCGAGLVMIGDGLWNLV